MAALSLLYLKRIVKKNYFELRTLELVSNLRTSTVYLRKGLQAQLEEITPSPYRNGALSCQTNGFKART